MPTTPPVSRHLLPLAFAVALPLGAETLVVPGLVSAAGRNGSRFESTLVLANPGEARTDVTLTLLPPPGSPPPAPVTLSLAAGETSTTTQALPRLFGRTDTFGTLVVTSSGPVAARVVTSNVAHAPGIYGLALGALRAADLLSAGETGHAIWVRHDGEAGSGARTNVTVAFLDPGTTVRLTAYDGAGARRGSLDVSATGPSTWQGAVGDVAGTAALPSGRVEAAVLSGRATGYLSVVDNVTGDGMAFVLTRAPSGASDWLVDGVARAAGRNGTSWSTDLRLFNPGRAPLRVTLDAVGIAPSPRPFRLEREVPAGGLVELSDVLGPGHFAVAGDAAGAVRVLADGPLLVAGRTSTPDAARSGGSFGTSLAPVRRWGGTTPAGRTVSFAALEHAAGETGTRTNVALLAGASGAAGTLALRSSAGDLLASAPFALGPREWRQQDLAAWLGGAAVPGAARLDVSPASGSLDVYATVVDNVTGDPVLVTGTAAPASCGGASAQAAASTVTVKVGAASGTIRPLLGVNIGPRNLTPGTADLTAAYRERDVTEVRTHDYYGPLDMATLFPSQAADPASPASYDFERSDGVYASIVEGPFEPYLRLGDSWNNAFGYPPARPRRPTNPDSWVKAAVEVVRHYDDPARWGHRPLRHVEIWNEPDNAQFWDGTREEFFSLFTSAAVALSAAHPHLSIGGPGLTPAGAMAPQGQAFTRAFLDHLATRKVPLDFFSFHVYSNDPDDFVRSARFYRQELDARGYTETRLHVTEWNTSVRDAATPDAAGLRTGGRGAAILTSAWIGLQEEGITASTLYRGPDPATDAWWFYGLFHADGTPKRIAEALRLWGRSAAHPDRRVVTVTGAPPGFRALAGTDDAGELAVLVANPGGAAVTFAVDLAASPLPACAEVLEVGDASSALTSRPVAGGTVTVPGFSVQLLLLRPAAP